MSFEQTDTEVLGIYIRTFKLKGLTPSAKRTALYELGFKLFYDKNLSGKKSISCQSCHSLNGFSGDTLPLGVGEQRYQENGVLLPRHAPALYNLGYQDLNYWPWPKPWIHF